jgi:hypothetical protein
MPPEQKLAKLPQGSRWLGRGAIEEAARVYANARAVDLDEWRLGAIMTSTRAAAIVCDDIV